MGKLQKVVAVIGGLLAILLLVASMQSSAFRVARSATIHAPPEVVFRILNDLRQGQRWSPFEQIDPEMKRAYSGPETGTGSTYSWDGNSQAGAGTMSIEESKPAELVRMKLDFTRPMTATNEVRFELTPSKEGTEVTWSMEGKKSFAQKAVCLFMDMDAMVGGEFEKGLHALDAVAQEETKTPVPEQPAEKRETPPEPAGKAE